MALPALLSAPQDARNISEYITSTVRDDSRISSFIIKADSIVRSALREIYSIESGLLESAAWNGPPQASMSIEDVTGNTTTASLLDVTIASTAVTETWTLTFTDTTNYTFTGSISGDQSVGAVGSDSSPTNGAITVLAASWGGATAAAGDIFFVTVYLPYAEIVACSTFLASGLLLKSVYQGTDGIADKGKEFFDHGMDLLKALQNPYGDDGATLGSLGTGRDITPEGTNYAINYFGHDVSKYGDNENTPWDDSSTGSGYGFFTGRIW